MAQPKRKVKCEFCGDRFRNVRSVNQHVRKLRAQAIVKFQEVRYSMKGMRRLNHEEDQTRKANSSDRQRVAGTALSKIARAARRY